MRLRTATAAEITMPSGQVVSTKGTEAVELVSGVGARVTVRPS